MLDVPKLSTVVQGHEVQAQLHKTFLGLKSRVVKRFSESKLFFYSLKEFMRDVNEWSLELPRNYDVICAIPRNGLLVGSWLSERWDMPLSTPELLADGLCWGSSECNAADLIKRSFKRILLVDDSVGSGNSMVDAEKKLRTCLDNVDVVKAALLASYDAKGKVDYFKRVYNGVDGLFEWSLPSNRYAQWRIAADLDGVICEEPPLDTLKDMCKYERWLELAKSVFMPSYSFEAIVSDRLERYRDTTTEWLRKHEVKYKALFLAESKTEHFHKITVLRKLKPKLYIESDSILARDIWKLTGIPTLCYRTMTLYS